MCGLKYWVTKSCVPDKDKLPVGINKSSLLLCFFFCFFNSGYPDTQMTWKQTAWSHLWQLMLLSCCWGGTQGVSGKATLRRSFFLPEIYRKLHCSCGDHKSVAAKETLQHTEKHTLTVGEGKPNNIFQWLSEHTFTRYKTVCDQRSALSSTTNTTKHTHMLHTCTWTKVTTTLATGLWVAGQGLDVEKRLAGSLPLTKYDFGKTRIEYWTMTKAGNTVYTTE